MTPEVLARARARVRGPVAVPVTEPVPHGMTPAADGPRVWLLPVWPDGATPALLAEYDTAPMPMERAGTARRVLAAALRCCWTELDTAPWPGRIAAIADVLDVYVAMTRGAALSERGTAATDLMSRWAVGDLRRLADSGWLLLDEEAGTVRLGPRTAAWPEEGLSSLRDLVRRLPGGPA